MKCWHFLGVLLAVSSVVWADADEAELASHLIKKARINRGICALPRCSNPELPGEMVANSGFLVHAQHRESDRFTEIREAVDKAGLLGHEVFVEQGTMGHLPFADNLIDVLVLTDLSGQELDDLPVTEFLRVLRPRGKAIIGRAGGSPTDNLTATQLRNYLQDSVAQEFSVWQDSRGTWAALVKPPMAGVDDWRHWAKEPDNNPYSHDTAISAPYITQWLAKPYYVAMPAVTTAADGRVFVATGHIAHHDREIPTLTLLTARNGYNGRILWQRDLPEGYMVHRSAFVATDDVFYMIDGNSCLMLDAKTGEKKGRISLPEVSGHWKWMAMKGGALYILAGEKSVPAQTTKVNSGRDHWSWGELSPGYYSQPRIPWGWGRTLAAYDLDKGKLLWKHQESADIDSRAVGICDGKLFFYAPGSRVGCLDAASGKVRWSTDDEEILEAIEQPGKGLISTPGFRSTCMLLCTPEALYFEAQTRMNIVALSAKDGSFMWKRRRTRNNSNLLYVDGKLIAQIGKNGTAVVLDPLTGETESDLGFHKRTCVRLTGCHDSFFCRGDGLGRWDRKAGSYAIDGTIRPGCNDGAIPANGLLYIGPWLCDCNLSLMGMAGFASAASDAMQPTVPPEGQLEQSEVGNVKPLDVTGRDWPTYRGDNLRTCGSPATVPGDVTQLWKFTTERNSRPSPLSAASGLVFLGSKDGKVRCLDAETGKLQWECPTTGPIMMPPSISDGRAYVGSGDGYVYALEARTGRRLWRFRAAPYDRRIMLYGALGSTWPVNSGVMVEDGTVYAAAGLADHDGTFVYALDARTGAPKWQNAYSGHMDGARNGVAVQGNLTIAAGRLWLAGGNQVGPASYDLETGKCLVQHAPPQLPHRQRGRNIAVFADEYIMNGGRLLYSGESNVISSANFDFFKLAANGAPSYPAAQLMERSSTAPAWDEDTFVYLTSRYSQLVCWDTPKMKDLFDRRRQQALALNQERAGMQKRRSAQQRFQRHAHQAKRWGPKNRDTLAIAVAANAVLTAGERPGDANGWAVYAFEKKTGDEMWRCELPAQPLLNGLAVDRKGRVLLALVDGSIVCFGTAR